MRNIFSIALASAAISLALAAVANAQQGLEPAAQRGFMIAKTNCMSCHSIDKASASPLVGAPPFRTLHQKYPVEHLEEAMAEGISTGHPSMPEFRFEPDQINDFIEFLKTLQN